jgi:hypothetical protein
MPKDEDVEELRQVLGTVSDMVPNLIKGIIGSVFSAEAGKSMGAAVASFYKELKDSGLPDEVAVKMTEDYAKSFTDMGKLIREAMSQKGGFQIPPKPPEKPPEKEE